MRHRCDNPSYTAENTIVASPMVVSVFVLFMIIVIIACVKVLEL